MWFWCVHWEERNSTLSSCFSVDSRESLGWPAVHRCQCLIESHLLFVSCKAEGWDTPNMAIQLGWPLTKMVSSSGSVIKLLGSI